MILLRCSSPNADNRPDYHKMSLCSVRVIRVDDLVSAQNGNNIKKGRQAGRQADRPVFGSFVPMNDSIGNDMAGKHGTIRSSPAIRLGTDIQEL